MIAGGIRVSTGERNVDVSGTGRSTLEGRSLVWCADAVFAVRTEWNLATLRVVRFQRRPSTLEDRERKEVGRVHSHAGGLNPTLDSHHSCSSFNLDRQSRVTHDGSPSGTTLMIGVQMAFPTRAAAATVSPQVEHPRRLPRHRDADKRCSWIRVSQSGTACAQSRQSRAGEALNNVGPPKVRGPERPSITPTLTSATVEMTQQNILSRATRRCPRSHTRDTGCRRLLEPARMA